MTISEWAQAYAPKNMPERMTPELKELFGISAKMEHDCWQEHLAHQEQKNDHADNPIDTVT